MNNIERRDKELPYISDESVMEEQKVCRRILQRLNTVDRSDFDSIGKIVEELLGKSENAFINPPFYCDYGTHIEVGKNFFANYNCTIIDVAKVKIGNSMLRRGKRSVNSEFIIFFYSSHSSHNPAAMPVPSVRAESGLSY